MYLGNWFMVITPSWTTKMILFNRSSDMCVECYFLKGTFWLTNSYRLRFLNFIFKNILSITNYIDVDWKLQQMDIWCFFSFVLYDYEDLKNHVGHVLPRFSKQEIEVWLHGTNTWKLLKEQRWLSFHFFFVLCLKSKLSL